MNNLETVLTLKINIGCNCNCSYCIEGNNHQISTTEDKIFIQVDKLPSILDKINKPTRVMLIGGEPGLWSYKLLGKILSIIDNTYGTNQLLSVCTNGLFMKKFPFLLNDKRFYYNYHIVNPENYDLLKDPYIKLPNVNTCIVVTKEIQNNYELLKNYKNLCNSITYELCNFPDENDKTRKLLYEFDYSNNSYFIKNKNSTFIGENSSCYNKNIEILPNCINLYKCCICSEESKIEINDNTDYNIINNTVLSFNQIIKNCKNCSQKFNGYSLNI